MYKILMVRSSFYPEISDMLLNGSRAFLDSHEEEIEYNILDVPGCFEIPAAINFALDHYDGFIALGCVIRGQTSHYDIVSRECSRAIMDITTDLGIPIGFGILTTENYEQALERADPKRKNLGAKAAEACIHMLNIKNVFNEIENNDLSDNIIHDY